MPALPFGATALHLCQFPRVQALVKMQSEAARSVRQFVGLSGYKETRDGDGFSGKEPVIEDDDGMREAIETLLSAAGIECAAYASAEAPSRMAMCIIGDLNLPAMSGLELLTELRARGTRPPIIGRLVFYFGKFVLMPLMRLEPDSGCSADLLDLEAARQGDDPIVGLPAVAA